MSVRKKILKTGHFQRQQMKYSEHCCVPLCAASSRFNGVLSFHAFPPDPDLRRIWLVKIRREMLPITSHTRVCSRHFASHLLREPSDPGGRRRLGKGAVPTLFEWNGFTTGELCGGVWERGEQPRDPDPLEERGRIVNSVALDHDYCSGSKSSAADDMAKELEELIEEVDELCVQRQFGLRRFSGSDEDICFYTRFPSYDHLMAFWYLIEPAVHQMVQVTRAETAARNNEEVVTPQHTSTRQLLQPVDEFFLFLVFLSLGLKERDLAHRFNVHQPTVRHIISTWTNLLLAALGSQCIWLTPEKVRAHLPEEFKEFPDTQVILDCTELRCQTPASLLLQSETGATYKTHFTMKGLVGIAPHGAVTFISDLFAGSISDQEIFKQSGISKLLTEDMAIMVDKGFFTGDCCKCKVYRPFFLSKQRQVPASQTIKPQDSDRLWVHLEGVIRRIKQNKLFDGVIQLSHTYNINHIFAVACLLSNYQNKPLIKKQVK